MLAYRCGMRKCKLILISAAPPSASRFTGINARPAMNHPSTKVSSSNNGSA